MTVPQGDLYNLPAYTATEVARYLHIPLATLRSWLNGRAYPTRTGRQTFAPLIQRPDPSSSQLSFTNLVEAHVLRTVRETHQVKLDKVRKALDYTSQHLNTAHPLARRQFQTDGIDLFVEQIGALVNVSRSGQLAMRETLKHLLTRVEWNADDLAARFFPFLHAEGDVRKLLTIDPRIAFGKPAIAGKGIPVVAIADLYEAGEDIAELADEFDCTPEQISAAVQFESLARAA